MWTLEHLQTRADGVCRGEVSVKMLHHIAQYAGVHGEGFSWSPVPQCRVSTMTILPGPDCLRHLPGVPHSDILDSGVIVMLPSSLALLFLATNSAILDSSVIVMLPSSLALLVLATNSNIYFN